MIWSSCSKVLLLMTDTGKILYEGFGEKARDVGDIYLLTHIWFTGHSWKNFLLKILLIVWESSALNDIEGAGTLPMEADQYTVEQLLTALLVGNSSTAALALSWEKWVALKSFVENENKLSQIGHSSPPHLINATRLNTQTISGILTGKKTNQWVPWYCAIIAKATYSGFSWSDQIYFKTDSSFSNTPDWKPQPWC